MIRISSSYSKKVPADVNYSSQSFHAGLEVELPDSLAGDRDALKRKLRGMFGTLKQAVDEQLQAAGNGQPVDDRLRQSDTATRDAGNGRRTRPATAAQRRAIHALAARAGEDVVGLIRRQFGSSPDDLSLQQASTLIDELKERANA